MGILTNAARALGLVRSETPDPSSPSTVLPPARSAASTIVTSREAMTLASTFRSFQILGTAVSQLSLGVWRNDVELDTPALLRQPDALDPDAAPAMLFEESTTSLAGTGNAYWRLHRVEASAPVLSLEVLPAAEVTAHPAKDNPRRVSHYTHNGRRLERWEVRHLKLLRVGGLYGLGPIQAAQADLRGALDVRDYATGWFDTSGMPSGVLKTDQRLNGEDAAEYREQWHETPAGRVRVLGAGLAFEPFMLKPADAQWLENQKFSVTQIARLMGIPATYLLAAIDGSSMNYTNQEQVDIAFVRYTLMAYLREIELAFSSVLPRGQQARFKVDALLRTDTKTRMETYEIGLRAGIYSLPWVQRTEGLPITAAPATTPAEETTDA